MNNGPTDAMGTPVYTPASAETRRCTDASYIAQRQGADAGVAQVHAEAGRDVRHRVQPGRCPRPVRDRVGQYCTYMTGDYPAVGHGCGAETAAPEAVYRFTIGTGNGMPTSAEVRDQRRGNDPHRLQRGGGQLAVAGDDVPGGGVVCIAACRPALQAPVNVGDTRLNPIPSGPDLAYLTYVGTTSGANSAQGLLGGISGCGADGKTNEVVVYLPPDGQRQGSASTRPRARSAA